MTIFYIKQILKSSWSLKYPTNFRKYCLILKSKLSYWINQMEGKNMSVMAFYYSGYNLTINYLMFYLTQRFWVRNIPRSPKFFWRLLKIFYDIRRGIRGTRANLFLITIQQVFSGAPNVWWRLTPTLSMQSWCSGDEHDVQQLAVSRSPRAAIRCPNVWCRSALTLAVLSVLQLPSAGQLSCPADTPQSPNRIS